MPAEKRNHFLDFDESDDDDDRSQGYDSDAGQLRKKGSSSKRRRVDRDDGTDEDEDEAEDQPLSADDDDEGPGEEEGTEDAEREGPQDEVRDDEPTGRKRARPRADTSQQPLSKKNLVATEKAVRRSGVIYISRIPPFMKPGTVRSIFERFGKINRTYLSPEDPQVRARRIQQGQNRKRNFNEGWLEFVRKAEAKGAVDLLNGTTLAAVGMAKKGSYYRDDIWSLRYLKGFKWHNLTEQIAAETAERQSRMRAEISKAAKENKEFVRNIQKAKELEGIQSKAAAKRSRDAETVDTTAPAAVPEAGSRTLRKFKQASAGKKKPEKTSEATQRVLSQLF